MKKRQAIIDGYLAATGRNMFNASEFIDWLAGRPDHEAYEWFYGMDDATAAREHRIALARSMASGLRITAEVQETPPASAPVKVEVREFPALVSPVAGRKDGGGYQPFNPDDPEMVAELRRQGAQALRSWLARYRGVADLIGVDVAPIEEIAGEFDHPGVVDAA
jgi:hypothetical protein